MSVAERELRNSLVTFTSSELSSVCDACTVDESDLAADGAAAADLCLVDEAREEF